MYCEQTQTSWIMCTNKTQTDRLTYLYKPGFLFGILNKWAKFEDDLQFRSYSSIWQTEC